MCVALRKGGETRDSNSIPNGVADEADGVDVATEAGAQLDPAWDASRLLAVCAPRRATEAGEAAAPDAAVHGAPASGIALPMQPDRSLAAQERRALALLWALQAPREDGAGVASRRF